MSRSGDLFVAEDSYTGDPDAMDVCIISPEREVSRFLKLTGNEHFLPGAIRDGRDHVRPERHAHVCRLAALPGTGIVYEISGPFRLERPVIPAPVRGRRPAPAPPGLPIGIVVARRISIASLIRRGLAVGLTLDRRRRCVCA